MTRLSTSTKTRPQTEMTVSISDQLARVCPTDSPKYSLTNQKPASLTCEKNSDPAPTASTSRLTWVVDSDAATGARMPAAVTVATVADPVASRISTATSQASSSTDRPLPATQFATSLPMPVSINVCLK